MNIFSSRSSFQFKWRIKSYRFARSKTVPHVTLEDDTVALSETESFVGALQGSSVRYEAREDAGISWAAIQTMRLVFFFLMVGINFSSSYPSSSMIWKVLLESLAMARQLRAKIPYGAGNNSKLILNNESIQIDANLKKKKM